MQLFPLTLSPRALEILSNHEEGVYDRFLALCAKEARRENPCRNTDPGAWDLGQFLAIGWGSVKRELLTPGETTNRKTMEILLRQTHGVYDVQKALDLSEGVCWTIRSPQLSCLGLENYGMGLWQRLIQ